MNIQGLREFLRKNTEKFRTLNSGEAKTPLHIVLGNESADLDSIISALLYAYYKQVKADENEIYIPIVNVPHEDIALRKELLFLIKPHNIDENSIIAIDEFSQYFPSNQFTSPKNSLQLTSVTLVDHNRLIESQRAFTPIVTEVVDHHADETNFLPNLSKKIVETVGSCTTLLAEIFVNDQSLTIDDQIANLLLATILIDTINFEESAKKTTPKDVHMADILTKIISHSDVPNRELQTKLFDDVNHEKSSVDSFTTNELLRKDYKEWAITSSNGGSYHLGMASAKISARKWLEKDADLVNQFRQFSAQRDLRILFVGTEFFDEANNYNREGILYLPTNNQQLFIDLVQFITQTFSATNVTNQFQFSHLNGDFVCVFRLESSLSRKVLSPKIVDFLST